ncbi:MAG: cell division protein FtsQ/DivIB [Variovorax sp.]
MITRSRQRPVESAPQPVPLDVRLMNLTAALLFVVVLIALAASAALWLARNPLFALKGIRVDGETTHSNATLLRATVAPQLVGSFLTVNLARTRSAFESVPWVRHAVVRREFPNRLRVTLTEHRPVAHWGDEADARLVDNFGEVFEAAGADVAADLPRLKGPAEQAGQVLGMYRTLQPLFEQYQLRINQLALSGRGSWQTVLDTGAVIELGRGRADEVAARTERFLRTLPRVIDQYGRPVQALESADLRHRDAYALRMRGITTTSPVEPKKK